MNAAVDNVVADYPFQLYFYQIQKWAFDFKSEKRLSKGFNDCLRIVFVRKNNFYLIYLKIFMMCTGHVVKDKPDYEYRLQHLKKECVSSNFTNNFYLRFLDDLNLKYSSLLLKSTPETEYLHFQITRKIPRASKLEMDNLLFDAD